jgi:GNAT superfamily N-acetyltransferase
VEIRRAAREDAEAILTIQRIAYQSEAALYPGHRLPPLRETLEELLAAFGDHLILAATDRGKTIGSARARIAEGTCHVGRLSVHPERQGEGVGTALLTAIETLLPEVERYELFTGGRSEKNLRLYEKLGYRPFKTVLVEDEVSLVYLEKINARRKEEEP